MRRLIVPPMTRIVSFGLLACAVLASAGCASHGREVFVREGCANCHRFHELGIVGTIDLSEIGSRRDAAWIRAKIVNSAAQEPASRMPPFTNISGFDLRSLVVFLRS